MTSPFNTNIQPVNKAGPPIVVLPPAKLPTADPGIYHLATIKVGPDGQILDANSNQVIDALANLTDVFIDTPANGDALIYNSSTGKWEAGAAGGGGSGLTHPQVMKRIHIGL